MSKGYAIVLLDVHDLEVYTEYARLATEIESRHGGRALVAGRAMEVVDGVWPTERTVVLEFPSIEHARAWYRDPDYLDLIALRRRSTVSHVLLIEGSGD